MSKPLSVDEILEQVRDTLTSESGRPRRPSDETEWAIRVLVDVLNAWLLLIPPIDEQRSHAEAHIELEGRIAECERLLKERRP